MARGQTPSRKCDVVSTGGGADLAEKGRSAQAEVALGRADVARRWPEQAARFLLLENMRGPAGNARTGEHRGRERRRYLGDVEYDRGVVLDIRSENTIGGALLKRYERRALELLRHLDVRRAELPRCPLQDARTGVLRAIDAMAEAHDALPLR